MCKEGEELKKAVLMEVSEMTRQLSEDIAELRRELQESQRINIAHQKKTEKMLNAWTNVQGFVRVAKWIVAGIIGFGLFIQVLKQLGIRIFWP